MLIARQFFLSDWLSSRNRWMPAPSNNPVSFAPAARAINPPNDRARFDWHQRDGVHQRRNQRPLPAVVPASAIIGSARQNGVKRDSSSGSPTGARD